MRLAEEEQFSAYSFDYADVRKLWEHLNLYEEECEALLKNIETKLLEWPSGKTIPEMALQIPYINKKLQREIRFLPVLAAFELALKCSHIFNLLDARGAISVTERVGVMARIRTLVVGVAKVYAAQGQVLEAGILAD
jgi:glycyl-tRNA synthetase alpha chain